MDELTDVTNLNAKSVIIKKLKKITMHDKQLNKDLSQQELQMCIKYTRTNAQIFGETVFGGNNFIFCLCRRNVRCFGGDKPMKLILSFVLINAPGLAFDLFVAINFESMIYLGIGVAL